MSQSKSKPEIYAFSGKLGAGKNYLAEKVFYQSLSPKNTLIMALADHFKVDAIAKDRVDYQRVFVKKDDETRRLLQKRGTEEGRDKYGADIWIRTLETWIQLYHERGVERFIITDIRFPNEARWIRKLGGLTFRVNAPKRNERALQEESKGNQEQYQAISQHPSEVGLDEYEDFDYVLNNDYGQEQQVTREMERIVNELGQHQQGRKMRKT